MELLSILIGMPIGIIASLIAWWILTHGLVPKIKHSPFISKVKNKEDDSYKYRIGIRNVGNRDMIDVEVIFELLIKGFDTAVPSNTSYIQLNINKPRLAIIKKKKQWALTINTSELPKSLLPKFQGCNLEELLNIRNAKAKVTTFGYDKFSGTRKVFESKIYTINDIVEKLFDKNIYEE